MTVKELKEWINEIPEEYDDMDLEITTYSDDGPEGFYRYDLGCGLGFGVYDIEIYRVEMVKCQKCAHHYKGYCDMMDTCVKSTRDACPWGL